MFVLFNIISFHDISAFDFNVSVKTHPQSFYISNVEFKRATTWSISLFVHLNGACVFPLDQSCSQFHTTFSKMNRLLFVTLLVCSIVIGYAVDIEVCDSPSAELGDVLISGCTDDDDVCPFYRNTTVMLSANFVAGQYRS